METGTKQLRVNGESRPIISSRRRTRASRAVLCAPALATAEIWRSRIGARHFATKFDQLRLIPGKSGLKNKNFLAPPQLPPFAPVKLPQIRVHPWLKFRRKQKITKRTHLSFFVLPVNTVDFRYP